MAVTSERYHLATTLPSPPRIKTVDPEVILLRRLIDRLTD